MRIDKPFSQNPILKYNPVHVAVGYGIFKAVKLQKLLYCNLNYSKNLYPTKILSWNTRQISVYVNDNKDEKLTLAIRYRVNVEDPANGKPDYRKWPG